MALTGIYTRKVDEKNRCPLPKQLREEFGSSKLESVYLAPGTSGSLDIYSPEEFDRLAVRISEKSPNRIDVRIYKRLFYGRAERVDLDSQGRIRIPERLIESAKLGREVVLVGVHDHVELWNSEVWNEFVDQHSAHFDQMAADAFE